MSAPPAPPAELALRLRHPVHRGSVLASGLVLDPAVLGGGAAGAAEGELEVRRRILAMSPLLAEVVRLERPAGGRAGASSSVSSSASSSASSGSRTAPLFAALFRAPVRLRCEAAAGAPLVRQGNFLSTAPLSPDELEALAQLAGALPRDALVLLRGGAVELLPLAEQPREDLSAWLDVSELQPQLELTPLGGPTATPREVLAAMVAPARDALGVAPLADEGAGLLRSLLGGGGGAGDGASSRGGATPGSPASPLGAGSGSGVADERGRWWSRLWGSLAARLAGERGVSGVSGTASSSSVATSATAGRGGQRALVAAPPPRSWLARAVGAVGNFSKRALLRTRLREVLGRRYARYLERMFEMFDGNRLDEALRHAIPLGGDVERALRELDISLSPPAPRDDLTLSPQRGTARSGVSFGAELYAALEERYRRAFERLRDQGDIEKAAFVLAELLRADEEATSFLEQHGKLRLAAELAEARQLPPGLVIRQWFLAGDPVRAVRLARRSGAFFDAVTRLTASHPEQARALRLAWAESLADSGAYGAAIDVIWPLEDAREVAMQWIDRAIAIGGSIGAIMMVRKLRVLPAVFPEVRAGVLALLAEEPPAIDVLGALGNELLAGEPTAELRVLMRAMVRRLLELRPESGVAAMARRLLDASVDAALRTDAGPVLGQFVQRVPAGPPASLATAAALLEVPWAAADRGAVAIFDACLLPDGKLLVALGEAGARVISAHGRVLAQFHEPAHQLVLSEHGDRAILVAPRGEVLRLARVDLLARRARHWCDVQLSHYAASYDGATWFVARGDTVYAIEANADRWQHSWKVDEPGHQVGALRREPHSLHVWFHTAGLRGRVVDAESSLALERSGELWRYELPQLALRKRTPVVFEGTPQAFAIPSGGGAITAWLGDATARRAPSRAEIWSGNTWSEVCLSAAPLLQTPTCNAELVAFAEQVSPLSAAELARAPLAEMAAHSPPSMHGVCVSLFDISQAKLRARVLLHRQPDEPAASLTAGARFQGELLLIFDSLGRLTLMWTRGSESVRRLRVS